MKSLFGGARPRENLFVGNLSQKNSDRAVVVQASQENPHQVDVLQASQKTSGLTNVQQPVKTEVGSEKNEKKSTMRKIKEKFIGDSNGSKNDAHTQENQSDEEALQPEMTVTVQPPLPTDAIAGKGCGISDTPITLEIVREGAPDLTLVDLPGITRVPISGQLPDIYEKISKIITCYKVLRETNRDEQQSNVGASNVGMETKKNEQQTNL